MTDGSIFSGPHWQRFATTDADAAHEYLRSAYVDVTIRSSDNHGEGPGLCTVATELGDVGMARLDYSAHTRLETVPDGNLNIFHVFSGRYSLNKDKDEHRIRPGEVALILPDDAQDVDFDDVRVFVTRLPRALLEEVADTPAGFRGAELRFDSTRPLTAQLGRHWLATASYVTRSVLSDPALAANPLIVAQARQHLARTALTVFPNTSLDARPHPDSDVRPRALRRAMAYIEANVDQPLTVAQIATAAGVHPRGLQQAFRRHLSTTPTNYLRTVRLACAHRDLQQADPSTGVTVTTIAGRWGFAHLGRFSTDYRSAYGTSPSRTLRT
jgi:AraC-like DNA-binding protein